MRIQILGTGCPMCKALEQHAREAVTELGLDAEIDKVKDIAAIMAMAPASRLSARKLSGFIESARSATKKA